MGRPDALTRRALLALFAAGLLLTSGCAGDAVDADAPARGPSGATVSPQSGRPATTPSPGSATDADRSAPGPAREGARAPSQVDRFAPTALILPHQMKAVVVPVATTDGELRVPAHVDELGWWDGSAWLGDPFGATVIAGHVDSATEGLGFFAQLSAIRVGERVSVVGSRGERQTYRVTSARTVAQNVLAADADALDQTGDHRLVLITCAGAYRPGRGYESNLVVIAKQVSGRQ